MSKALHLIKSNYTMKSGDGDLKQAANDQVSVIWVGNSESNVYTIKQRMQLQQHHKSQQISIF